MYHRDFRNMEQKLWKARGVKGWNITSHGGEVLVWGLCKYAFRQNRAAALKSELSHSLAQHKVNGAPPLSDIIFPDILHFIKAEFALSLFDLYQHLASVVAPHLSITGIKCMLSLFNQLF